MPGSATDPTALYRLHDGIYAPDLLIAAVAELDLFTRVARAGTDDVAGLCAELQLDARAADVMVTCLSALGLLERDADDRFRLSGLAREHLVAGSPLDLRPYFASLRERPGCAALLTVLRTGRPAGWASATGEREWTARLDDPEFAARFSGDGRPRRVPRTGAGRRARGRPREPRPRRGGRLRGLFARPRRPRARAPRDRLHPSTRPLGRC